MPNKEFLETFPLYRKFDMDTTIALGEIKNPAINMNCPICRSGQTFNWTNDFFDGTNVTQFYSALGVVLRVIYTCNSCNTFNQYFLLKFDPGGKYVMKVGQEPPWDITPDRTLENKLDTHIDYYKKGLICESQSYGIGAFAYYRRIVEEIIDDLLGDIANLINGDDKEVYLKALGQVKKTPATIDKIDLVKELLPPILRPGGVNPLSALHSALSEGLHGKTDDDCIELAEAIREVLVFLVNQVKTTKEAGEKFTESMKKLLDRKKK